MEPSTSTASLSDPEQHDDYNEISPDQMFFGDSLKDLKNLRTQLYSAAEYFEQSYTNDDQKHMVVDTLKDYAVKALVNTVDHLGSVSFKVNDFFDEKVEEVSGTEFRMSCIGQRLRTCTEYTDREGLAQQSSVIDAPRYHKRYVLPVGEASKAASQADLGHYGYDLDEHNWHQHRKDEHNRHRSVRPTSSISSSSQRRGRSVSPSLRTPRLPGAFSFGCTPPKKDGRSDSPHRLPLVRSGSLATRPAATTEPHQFPLLRSGSLAVRATTQKPSRSSTPNTALERPRYPVKPSKSASMRVHDVRESQKEMDRQPSKSKRLLKALLSRRKSKKDDMLYTYLDEY